MLRAASLFVLTSWLLACSGTSTGGGDAPDAAAPEPPGRDTGGADASASAKPASDEEILFGAARGPTAGSIFGTWSLSDGDDEQRLRYETTRAVLGRRCPANGGRPTTVTVAVPAMVDEAAYVLKESASAGDTPGSACSVRISEGAFVRCSDSRDDCFTVEATTLSFWVRSKAVASWTKVSD